MSRTSKQRKRIQLPVAKPAVPVAAAAVPTTTEVPAAASALTSGAALEAAETPQLAALGWASASAIKEHESRDDADQKEVHTATFATASELLKTSSNLSNAEAEVGAVISGTMTAKQLMEKELQRDLEHENEAIHPHTAAPAARDAGPLPMDDISDETTTRTTCAPALASPEGHTSSASASASASASSAMPPPAKSVLAPVQALAQRPSETSVPAASIPTPSVPMPAPMTSPASKDATMPKLAGGQTKRKPKRKIEFEDEGLDLLEMDVDANMNSATSPSFDGAHASDDMMVDASSDPPRKEGHQKLTTKNNAKGGAKINEKLQTQRQRGRTAALRIVRRSSDDPCEYDPRYEVARLETNRAGIKQVLSLQLNRPFVVGRSPDSDYVVPDPRASRSHFRLYAHRTDSDHSFVYCEDLSAAGLLVNGVRMRGSLVILNHGDVLQIPGCQTFVYTHLIKEDQVASGSVVPLKRWLISERVLGTGSYAAVLLAADSRTGYQVACKKQNKSKIRSDHDRKNVRREYKLLKKLSHPNINRLVDCSEDTQHIYFFMNLVCAGDLFNFVVGSNGRLMDSEAKFVFYQLTKAVQYLHSNGVAHRDIKPENVLLLNYGRFPRVQLGDFGLATSFELMGDAPPRAGSQCGTAVYLSGEALRVKVTQEEYDPRGLDTWAMGATLYLMLTGAHPFDYGDQINVENLHFQIQQYLLKQGVIDEGWIREYGIEEDEELALSDGSAADVGYAAKAKQDLVRRIFEADYYPLPDEQAKPAASELVAALLEPNPDIRLRSSQILYATWMRNSAKELAQMYDARVLSRYQHEIEVMKECAE